DGIPEAVVRGDALVAVRFGDGAQRFVVCVNVAQDAEAPGPAETRVTRRRPASRRKCHPPRSTKWLADRPRGTGRAARRGCDRLRRMTVERPPEAIEELVVNCLDYVRRASGVELDFTPETLSVLDHYAATARAASSKN